MKSPETWRQVRLGEICEINPRLPDGMELTDDMEVSFLPMASVDEVFGEISEIEDKLYREVKKGFTPFVENDLLFAKITPSMENGKAAIAQSLTNQVGFGSTEFHVIRCAECVLPEFIFHFVRQPSFRHWAKSSFIGSAGQQRVPADFLARIPFLLPTIPEQKHIVDILKQADALRRQRREILEQAKQLPIALFLEMFGDPITNQNGYREKLLSALGDLDRGISKHRPRDAEFLFGGKSPFIQTGDVTNSGGWISSYSQTYSEAGVAQSRLWPAGTLCITIAANIAKTGLLEFDACFPDSVVGFKAGDDVTSEYVMFALNLWQSVLEAQAPQAAQKNINLKVLRGLRIPVPPKPEQDQFTSFVREIRKSSVEQAAIIEDIETFGHQLYVNAYSGMLTRTWRESHSDVLESWIRDHPECVPKKTTRVAFKESAPPERAEPARPTRRWLMDQLGEVQANVYWALREWKGTLIPSEDLDRFLEEWPVEHLEDAHDHVLRALNQLAGLGFIARVSVPNQAGEYVTGYRVLREDELTKTDDLARLGAVV